MSYRLTVRHGSSVRREQFVDLDQAVEAMIDAADEVRREGPLEGVRMLREFDPAQRVAARIEISTGGLLRKRDAGVDVMGNGAVVAFAGGIRRRQLDLPGAETAYEAVRRELAATR